jgi:hypothetical protein
MYSLEDNLCLWYPFKNPYGENKEYDICLY